MSLKQDDCPWQGSLFQLPFFLLFLCFRDWSLNHVQFSERMTTEATSLHQAWSEPLHLIPKINKSTLASFSGICFLLQEALAGGDEEDKRLWNKVTTKKVPVGRKKILDNLFMKWLNFEGLYLTSGTKFALPPQLLSSMTRVMESSTSKSVPFRFRASSLNMQDIFCNVKVMLLDMFGYQKRGAKLKLNP